MNTKISKLTTFMSCFCGRYEYREMNILLKAINDGTDVPQNLEKLKIALENFQCVSTLEISQRKEALEQISLILSELQNNPEHVQPSETPADDAAAKDTGNTEAQDAQGVADKQVKEPEVPVEQPTPEEPAPVEQPEEVPVEQPTPVEQSAETPSEQPTPAPEEPAKPAAKKAAKK